MITVQGREHQTHYHHPSQVHIINEYDREPICGQLPAQLHRVRKPPTCKHCILESVKHRDFLEWAKGPVTPASGFHVWDYPPADFFVHFEEPMRLRLLAELVYRGHYGTTFHHGLRRTSHAGGRRSNHPGSFRIRNAARLAKVLGIPLRRMEQEIAVVHQGTNDNGLYGPFPKQPNEDWAWLVGLWYGCGRYNVPDRVCPPSKGHKGGGYRSHERTVAFHVEIPVMDELVKAGRRIGVNPVVSTYMQHENKRFTRINVFFAGAVYYLLRAWGLPPMVRGTKDGMYGGGGRQRTSREVFLHVPEFVRRDPKLHRPFVEGYLNSSKFQAWHKVDPGDHMKDGVYVGRKASPTGGLWHKRGCFLTFTGEKEKDVVEFMGFVATVFRKTGVDAHPYRMKRVNKGLVSKNTAFKLQLNNDDRLLRSFRIYKENATALIR